MTDTVQSLRDKLLQLKSLHESGALEAPAYESARAGLERRLVDLVTSGAAAPAVPMAAPPVARASKALWGGVAAVALVIAGAGYVWTGRPGAIGAAPAQQAEAGAQGAAPHALDPAQIAALTEKLAARLKDKPDDPTGWSMLGRAYMVLGKPADAVVAYERAVKLRPDDAAILADYADAMAMNNGRDLAGEPTRLIERALKLEPDNLKALMLAGSAAFNRNDFAAAVKYFDHMAQVGPADDPMVREAASGAAEARVRGKLPPAPAAATAAAGATALPGAGTAAAATAATSSDAAVSGKVSLAPALKAQAGPEDTVFIFARPAEGSRMPLAILRKQVKDLPVDFRLDDSMAMSPQATVSKAGRVIVGARVSKSGQAMPQPGDLEGLSAPVAVGTSGIDLIISAPVR